MYSKSLFSGWQSALVPFLLSVPIGLVGVVISLLLGVREAGLTYPGAFQAAIALGLFMGAIWAWRARSERRGKTMDLGSAWRAPLLSGGLLAAGLLFADPVEKAELVMYAGLLSTSLGLAGTLFTRCFPQTQA